jgi:REP element-mobilizing transposase RayT
LSHAAGIRLPSKGATGAKNFMDNIVNSGSPKKIAGDTRNNWVTMMFVTHNRYNCLRKQIYIEVLLQAFHDLEHFGFEFGEFGFALNHVHFLINIPKHYSVQTAEIMLKSYTAKKCSKSSPGFENVTLAAVFGADTTITSQPDGKTLNNQLSTVTLAPSL